MILNSAEPYSLQKFSLYETKSNFYLIGRDKSRERWKVLKIDRSEPSQLNVYEDPAVYTRQECTDLLNRLAYGNKSSGGINLVTKAYGIVGFIKFLEPYYMILITKRRLLGNICGHSIYGISESQLVTIPHSSVLKNQTYSFTSIESRYKKLFSSIDLSRDFFFSYSYRIMWTLQRNMNVMEKESMPYDDMFVWNSFLTHEFRDSVKSTHWSVALVYGFFKQVKLTCEATNFTLTLIARRSRHFAGTRYFKRGVNGKGRVANDVETEQLVHDEKIDQISSIVQHRGSIPLYWSQEISVFSPKPDIKIHKNETNYEATMLHFQNLVERYGNPIFVLNLVKTVEKIPRESPLSREFANAVANLNHVLPKAERIKFFQWDIHLFSKRKTINILEILESVANKVLDMTGFYYKSRASTISLASSLGDALNKAKCQDYDDQPVKERLQNGVLRTNCIDCLDRTNVAQFAFGLAALGRQMHALGLSSSSVVSPSSSLAVALMEIYQNMGDVLALQYGGSSAHNKFFSQWKGKWSATIESQEFFRSVVRHYNNAYLDGEKQDAINIFLGQFRPEVGQLALWQLESNNHLQIRRAGDNPMNDLRSSFKRSFSTGNMMEESEKTSLVGLTEPKLAPVKKPLMDRSKRGVTISEAELKKCLEQNDAFSCQRYESEDVSHIIEANGGIPQVALVSSNGNGNVIVSTDLPLGDGSSQSQSPNDCVNSDSLSSSANSCCEEDGQERHVVSLVGRNDWQTNTVTENDKKEEDNCCADDDYFEDLTALLMKVKSHKWESGCDLKTQNTVDMNGDAIKPASSCDDSPDGTLSERFINWIQDGPPLCF